MNNTKLNRLKLSSLSMLLCSFFGTGCADSPPDFPDNQQLRCEELNGVCTYDPAVICPPGKQPFTSDDPGQTNCVGQCCVDQTENNSCNPVAEETDTDAIAIYNCIPDADTTVCPGSWAQVSGNVSCEEGRSCCYWRF